MRSSGLDMGMDKEEATLRKVEGSKFLDKRSTQVGGKLMNFDWLHLICAYSCACLHLHKSLNLKCMLVWCMLVVELE